MYREICRWAVLHDCFLTKCNKNKCNWHRGGNVRRKKSTPVTKQQKLFRNRARASFWKTATIHIQIIKQFIQTKCANKFSVEPSIFRQYQRLCCGSNKTEQALNWISWSYIIHHKALTLFMRVRLSVYLFCCSSEGCINENVKYSKTFSAMKTLHKENKYCLFSNQQMHSP